MQTPDTDRHAVLLRTSFFVLTIVLLALTVIGPVQADDRDLLREAGGNPYIFFIFDTSGSMHWTPKCSQADFDAGICSPLCPSGDCYNELAGDDSASKFRQAKEALYEVIQDVDDVSFGFATYNQDALRARSKHWIYEATSNGPNIPGYGPYPNTGLREVFGFQWSCDTGRNDNNIGCYGNWPADLDDTWEADRVRRLPKGGSTFSSSRVFYVRSAGTVYRLQYSPVAGAYGLPALSANVQLWRCNNSSCSSRSSLGSSVVTYQRVEEFLAWDAGVQRNARRQGYFSQSQASDSGVTNTCAGWDPNDDTSADTHSGSGINLKWPTVASTFDSHLDLGDVIPLDWTQDNKTRILQRLAPNLALGETSPDFGTSRYFQNNRNGDGVLELKNTAARPLIASGATPLGNSIRDFREWFAGCSQGSCPGQTGWKDLAAQNDPDWGCRRTFLIVITDGDDTCSGPDACSATASLFAQEGVPTYVIAFGVENTSGNRLNCMAANGGTGDPVYPRNKAELVAALRDIVEGILREQSRAFASAAVPSVQAAVEDKIYLSSFTPLNDEPVWDGHLDAFLQPLPIAPNGRPDTTISCASNDSGCHLWDAGEKLFAQAADPVSLASADPDYNLGDGNLERRIFYSQGDQGVAPVPRPRRLFLPPADPALLSDPLTYGADWQDLLFGMGITYDPVIQPTPTEAAKDVIKWTLSPKQATVEDPETGTIFDIDYILGDIFHSSPVVVGNPSNFFYFVNDIDGYRAFADLNRVRRRVVLVGANDGQLHAFDAGIYEAQIDFDSDLQCDIIDEQLYTNGTGHEIFSFIPRAALPTIADQSDGTAQKFSIDGTITVEDVRIDPENSTLDPPAEADRIWRSVVTGGMREGGRGYYALDITTPDRILSQQLCNSIGVERDTAYAVQTSGGGYVPFCSGVDSSAPSSECGPNPYPSVLWEFEDLWDEDANGFSDMGDTWSTPTVGRIRVCNGTNCDPTVLPNDIEDRYVLAVGGGYDATVPLGTTGAGNFFYLIDMETGKILYKRAVDGAVPSELAAVDTSLDGYIDTIYAGTTAGSLYKVDLRSIPQIQNATVVDALTGISHGVERITSVDWEPYRIFDSGGAPIFFPPAVVFVAEAGGYALSFGVGDREDLWRGQTSPSRYYTIVDEGFDRGELTTPLLASDYTNIPVLADPVGDNYLLASPPGKRPGWFFELGSDERLITKPFVLSGVLFFTAYRPEVVVVGGGTGGPGGGPPGGSNPLCARTGESRIFVVKVVNGDPLLNEEGSGTSTTSQKTRYLQVPEFVTDPFAELSGTRNATVGGASGSGTAGSTSGGTGGGPPSYADEICRGQQLSELREDLKSLFPDTCRFANQTVNIQTIRSDRGLVCVAPVPVCVVEKNWREF